MKITRIGRVSSIALVSALALSACGSDNNSGSDGGDGDSGSGSAAAASSECGTSALKAEGSSAQDNAIQEVIVNYKDECPDANVTYNATGSGAGIQNFISKQVNFAGSDSALKSEDGKTEQADADKACASPAWNLPMVTGPIAISYKLDGVDKLILTPSLIAQIFDGKITKWNDAAIAKANPGVTLPSKDIKVFFRSDESGTTENFTKYLAASAPNDWKHEPEKAWPGKVGQGKAKTAGVASAVASTDGSISYAEWSAAKDNKLGIAQVDNGAGAVELTGESAGKAVASAKVVGEGNDLKLKLDYATKTAGAYPIVLVTYEIVCSKYSDAAVGKSVKSFLNYFASADQQKGLEEVGYAPLPDDVQTKVEKAISAIQ